MALPPEFGDYTSFLEIAFALNVLFNAWQAIPTNLARRRPGLAKHAESAGVEGYDFVRTLSEVVVWGGRALGIVAAVLIVAALYGLPDDTPVDWASAVAILLAVAPLPLTFVLVYLIYGAFLLWLAGRNVKDFVAEWWSVIVLARDIRRTERMRELWQLQRQSLEDDGEPP